MTRWVNWRRRIPVLTCLFLLAAPLAWTGQPPRENAAPSPNLKSPPAKTAPRGRPPEPENAFPKIAEKEPGGMTAEPGYLQRFSHARSSLKVKVWTNRKAPRFNPLEQLDQERRERLELRPLLPPLETQYDPVQGVISEPEPVPLFGF